jgi:hypothetical protein
MECKLLSGVMQDTIISQNTRYLHIIVLEMVETLEVDLKFIVIDICSVKIMVTKIFLNVLSFYF